MKLKTLKDLGMKYLKPPISETGYCMGMDIVDKRELKKEAIKWVKDEDKLSPSAKAGFKEFHNITEDDLYPEGHEKVTSDLK